jgi:hypothetical protein
MSEKAKTLTGVPKPTTGAEKRTITTGNNPVAPRRTPKPTPPPADKQEK